MTHVVTPGQGLLSIPVWICAHCFLLLIASLVHCSFHSYCVTSWGYYIALSAGKFPTLGSVEMTGSVFDWATFLYAHIRVLVTTLSSFSLSFRRGKWILFPVFINTSCVCAALWLMMSYLCWCHTGGLCVLRDILQQFPWFLNTAHIQHGWHLPSTFKAKVRG